MAQPTSQKRSFETAFPESTSPPTSPEKRSRLEESDDVQDIARVSITDFSLEAGSGLNLRFRDIQLLPDMRSLRGGLFRRELGMPHSLNDPNNWYQKGLIELNQDRCEEALRFFKIAEASCKKTCPLLPKILYSIGETAYQVQKYSDSAEAWEKLADLSLKHRLQAYLTISLCMAKMGDWESFNRWFCKFEEMWTEWFVIHPSTCPLSLEEYEDHEELFYSVISELTELKEDAEEAVRSKINLAIFSLYFAMEDEECVAAMEELYAQHPDQGLVLQMLYLLKKGTEAEKEQVFRFLEEILYQNEENEQIVFDLPFHISKLLFNDGLQRGNTRSLELALNFFHQAIRMKTPTVKERNYIFQHIFFCNFALERYELAFEMASSMTQLTPVSKGLCLLARGEIPTDDLIADFTQALEMKDASIGDPIILNFVAHRLRQPHSEKLDEVADSFEKWARSYLTYTRELSEDT